MPDDLPTEFYVGQLDDAIGDYRLKQRVALGSACALIIMCVGFVVVTSRSGLTAEGILKLLPPAIGTLAGGSTLVPLSLSLTYRRKVNILQRFRDPLISNPPSQTAKEEVMQLIRADLLRNAGKD